MSVLLGRTISSKRIINIFKTSLVQFVPTCLCLFNLRPELISDANIAINIFQRLWILAENVFSSLPTTTIFFQFINKETNILLNLYNCNESERETIGSSNGTYKIVFLFLIKFQRSPISRVEKKSGFKGTCLNRRYMIVAYIKALDNVHKASLPVVA